MKLADCLKGVREAKQWSEVQSLLQDAAKAAEVAVSNGWMTDAIQGSIQKEIDALRNFKPSFAREGQTIRPALLDAVLKAAGLSSGSEVQSKTIEVLLGLVEALNRKVDAIMAELKVHEEHVAKNKAAEAMPV